MSELLKTPEVQEDEELFAEDEQVTFVVDDDKKAEWCLNKIREAEAEKAKWKEYYDEMLKKITDQEDRRIEYMKFLLQQYFRTVPHRQTKTQESYKLPGGKLVLKRQAPEFERDDEALLPWLKENIPALVKVKESPDWANLKKHLTIVGDKVADPDGEIVPGITVHDRPDVFVAEVD